MCRRNRYDILDVLPYLIRLFFVVVLFLFAILHDESGTWKVDLGHSLRFLPFFVIYILLEIFFFPRHRRTKSLFRYMVGSLSMVVLVSFIWSFWLDPMLPKGPRDKEMEHPRDVLVVDPGFRSQLHQWVDIEHLNGAQLADSCQAYQRQQPDDEPLAKGTPPPPPPQQGPPLPPPDKHSFIFTLLLSLGIYGIFTTIHFLFQIVRSENMRKEMEKMKVEAELKQLRYQLSPHFLMNTLNNIHSLIDIDTESAQQAVRLLSKMMRYMLNDASKEKIALSLELQFLDHYFQLMRMRYIDCVEIIYKAPTPVPDVQIPPAILVNLAENSFKHGITYNAPSFIHFLLDMEDGYLSCRVVNSQAPEQSQLSTESGVGVANIRKRLDLLYPDRYVYEIKETDAVYEVILKIPV